MAERVGVHSSGHLRIPATLMLVAPAAGSGGVGDYAEEFIAEAVPHFFRYREVRTGGPDKVTVLDVIRGRARLSREIRDAQRFGPVVIHFELSAGSIAPFWLLAGHRQGVTTTATVHDPPLTVWWPFRSRLVAKSDLVHHGIHFPLRRLSILLERLVLKGTVLFTLSDTGSSALRERFPSCEVKSARHFVPTRPALRPAPERPLAVGLYGHAYKGKGFDRLLELRGALPADVEIRVAGRGTQDLPPIQGVTILGPVEGADEDAFFDSVRAILLPYDKTSRYYGDILPVSGVASRAFAYRTPVIAFHTGTLGEASRDGGLLVSAKAMKSLADLAYETITNRTALEKLEEQTACLQEERGARKVLIPFLEHWKKTIVQA